MTGIDVESGYGARLRRPIVHMSVGEASVQMSPAKALEVAGLLVGAAHTALADAAAIDAFGGERLTTDECAALLLRLRASRAHIDEIEGVAR